MDRQYRGCRSAAYYTFHPTCNPPSALALAALGFRDVAPQTLRVRALRLEAKLSENESFNPELGLSGRFDFAFVVIYLAPLSIIALMQDLVPRERESGRHPLLMAMSRSLELRKSHLCTVLSGSRGQVCEPHTELG
jgi:ABC-2 type transport system permease protein